MIRHGKRRRLENYVVSSQDADGVFETTHETQQVDDTVVSLNLGQKEALKQQMMAKCLQNSQPALRLTSLKEMCSFLFIDFLTGSRDTGKTPTFIAAFNMEVAIVHPDLLLDTCKHWLNLVYYRLPTAKENQEDSARLYTKTLHETLDEVIAANRHVALHDGGAEWVAMLLALNISAGA